MKTPTFWQFVVGLFLVATLAGCTAVPAATPGEENSASLPKQTAVPALNPVTPTAQSSPAATKDHAFISTDDQDDTTRDHEEVKMGDAVLVYQRAGGLKGIRSNDRIWYFYLDGRVTTSDGRSWRVKKAEIDALMNDIQPSQFATFDESYMPEDTCCDRYFYTLVVRDGDQIYQTSTVDGADAPPELFEAIDAINTFILALPN